MKRRLVLAATALALASLSGCATLPTVKQLAAGPAPHADLPDDFPLLDGRSRFRQIFCDVLAAQPDGEARNRDCADWLWNVGEEWPAATRPLPAADTSPQVFLVTGAFSECVGEEAAPFRDAARQLASRGYRISTIVVSGRSGSSHNARQIAQRLEPARPGEEGPVVLVGYSKGTNDILQFLVEHPGPASRVTDVVSVAGAVGGSPLAELGARAYRWLFDWIPSSRCVPGDGAVVDDLRPEVRKNWLASHPLPRETRYHSLAAFTTRDRVARALYAPWKALLEHDRYADGQLLARDMLIPGSTLLGYVNADHWSAAVDVEAAHPVLGARLDPEPFPRLVLLEAVLLQLADEPGDR